jgi:amidase
VITIRRNAQFWSAAEPYLELVKRDPKRLRIALSHEWGDYKATPRIAAELQKAGRLLQGLGHDVDWATPAVDFRAAYAAQTECYITNVSTNIDRLSKLRGHDRPPPELIEPMNMKIWEAGIGKPYTARAAMQTAFNTTSRAFGDFFETWDILLTPIPSRTTHRLGTLDYITLLPSR